MLLEDSKMYLLLSEPTDRSIRGGGEITKADTIIYL